MKRDEMKTPKELWLEEYSKESTKSRYQVDFDDFCQWAQTNDAELVAEYNASKDKKKWAKRKGAEIVKFYNWLITEKGFSTNYARSKISAIRAFLKSQCDIVKIKRGAIARPKIAMGEHEFTQPELRKMFHYGDVRDKAILSTATALGWGAGDFVKLKRDFLTPFLEKPAFTGFFYERGKTGAISRSHLTPECIESLKQWLEIAPKSDYVWCNGNGGHITDDTLNNVLRAMVQKAAIKTTGKVHFHLIRKFLMSQLSNAGLNQWHVKFMIGKSIPADIQTYLVGMKENLAEEYEGAYERFNLSRYQNKNHDRIGQLELEVEKLKEQNKALQDFIRNFGLMFNVDATERIRKLLETGKLDKATFDRMLKMLIPQTEKRTEKEA